MSADATPFAGKVAIVTGASVVLAARRDDEIAAQAKAIQAFCSPGHSEQGVRK